MRDVSLKIICFLKEVRKANPAVFTTFPEKKWWNALVMSGNTKDRMFPNVRAGKDPKGIRSTALVGSLRQGTEGEWLRGLHSSGSQLWMPAHAPSVSVALVNINDCVDKLDPAKGRTARFSRRVFISAPRFPHGILHVCVSQGGDERAEHGAIMV